MTVNPIFLMEFLLFNGGALAWAAWEYWQVRPSRARRESETDTPEDDSPQRPGHPER